MARTDRHADLVLAADVLIYAGALEEVFRTVRRILEPGCSFASTVESTLDTDDSRLLPSLRYAHSEACIHRLAEAHGLSIRDLQQAPLRDRAVRAFF